MPCHAMRAQALTPLTHSGSGDGGAGWRGAVRWVGTGPVGSCRSRCLPLLPPPLARPVASGRTLRFVSLGAEQEHRLGQRAVAAVTARRRQSAEPPPPGSPGYPVKTEAPTVIYVFCGCLLARLVLGVRAMRIEGSLLEQRGAFFLAVGRHAAKAYARPPRLLEDVLPVLCNRRILASGLR